MIDSDTIDMLMSVLDDEIYGLDVHPDDELDLWKAIHEEVGARLLVMTDAETIAAARISAREDER